MHWIIRLLIAIPAAIMLWVWYLDEGTTFLLGGWFRDKVDLAVTLGLTSGAVYWVIKPLLPSH